VIPTAPAKDVLANRKPRLLFRLSVVFLLRLAERRFCGLLFQEPPRTTRRQGAVQASRGRLVPPALEDRVAQPPRVGMRGVRDPCADARVDAASIYRPRPPAITQAPQSAAETMDILLRQHPAAVLVEHEAEEVRGLGGGHDPRLFWMQAEPPALEELVDPGAPLTQHGRVVVEQGKIVDIAHVGRTEHLGHEVVEPVEVEVGEELAGQIADRKATAPLVGREEIVAGIVLSLSELA